MSHEKIGPKEAALRQMRADKIAKPSTVQLRAKVEGITPATGKRKALKRKAGK